MSSRHEFDPTTSGRWCNECGLPRSNARVHLLDAEIAGIARSENRPQTTPMPPRRPAAVESLGDPVARVRPGAPETSRDAAAKVPTEKRLEYVRHVAEYGPQTDDEIEVALNRGHGAVSGATSALRETGWLAYVYDDGGEPVKRPIRSGNRAQVFDLTPAARDFLARERGAA